MRSLNVCFLKTSLYPTDVQHLAAIGRLGAGGSLIVIPSPKLVKSQSPTFILGRGFCDGSSESKTGKISKTSIFLGVELLNCDPESKTGKIPKSYFRGHGRGGGGGVVLDN